MNVRDKDRETHQSSRNKVRCTADLLARVEKAQQRRSNERGPHGTRQRRRRAARPDPTPRRLPPGRGQRAPGLVGLPPTRASAFESAACCELLRRSVSHAQAHRPASHSSRRATRLRQRALPPHFTPAGPFAETADPPHLRVLLHLASSAHRPQCRRPARSRASTQTRTSSLASPGTTTMPSWSVPLSFSSDRASRLTSSSG